MPIESLVEVMAKLSTVKYLWLAWKHKRLGKHYWIDNSWFYPSPSAGYHCGRRCLFCGKKMYALSGTGWFDEDDKYIG